MNNLPSKIQYNNTKISEEQLISLLIKQDPIGIQYLNSQYKPIIIGVIKKYVNDNDSLLDLYQDILLTILNKISTFNQKSKLATWLYSISYNICRNYIRKHANINETSLEQIQLSHQNRNDFNSPSSIEDIIFALNPTLFTSRNSPIQNIIQKEEINILQSQIKQLPNQLKEIFILKEIEGYSLKEISIKLNESIPNLKNKLHKSRAILKEALEQHLSLS